MKFTEGWTRNQKIGVGLLYGTAGIAGIVLVGKLLFGKKKPTADATWRQRRAEVGGDTDALVREILSDQDGEYVSGWLDALFSRGVLVLPTGDSVAGYAKVEAKDLKDVPSSAAERAWLDRVQASSRVAFHREPRIA